MSSKKAYYVIYFLDGKVESTSVVVEESSAPLIDTLESAIKEKLKSDVLPTIVSYFSKKG